MEMYTTDTIPTSESRPIRKAWLVIARPGNNEYDRGLAALQREAAEGGADAIIGLRIVMAQSESNTGFSQSFVAYGTAVKRS
jgi:hypothetical protein